jgi:hypothetical protein
VPLLTETEAKKRWCPFSRVALSMGMAANRSGAKSAGLDPHDRNFANVFNETRCLGSGCMVWEPLGLDASATERRGRCGLSTATYLES